jgi:hypothetical protein
MMKECRECKAQKPESEFYLAHGRVVARCKSCYRTKTRLWNQQFKTKEREVLWAKAVKVKRAIVKDAVFEAYGGYVCACCGETHKGFLSLDHIGNDGAKWRVALFGARNYAGYRTYAWLFKNRFPAGFQVLCMNCNFGKRMNVGVCPHSVTSNDYPKMGVGASAPKRLALVPASDDIVSPAMKVAAVRS